MAVYFFIFWAFFLTAGSVLSGFFKLVSDGFWGYHEKIVKKIEDYTSSYDSEEGLMVQGLRKQSREIEDILSQYVFYRFCENLSVYLSQINMVMLLCISLLTALFAHSAILTSDYGWLAAWMAAYGAYLVYELSGIFNKFEVWAANMFMKQYRVMNREGGARSIVEAKKNNKKTQRRLYLFFIVPLSFLVFGLLMKYSLFPVLPRMDAELQSAILGLWIGLSVPGIIVVSIIPVVLDKLMNVRLKFSAVQLKQAYFGVMMYIFLALMVSIAASASRYVI